MIGAVREIYGNLHIMKYSEEFLRLKPEDCTVSDEAKRKVADAVDNIMATIDLTDDEIKDLEMKGIIVKK